MTAQSPQSEPSDTDSLALAGLEVLGRACRMGVVLLDAGRQPRFACSNARSWLGSGDLTELWQAVAPLPWEGGSWQWQGEVEGRPLVLTFDPHPLEGGGTLVVIRRQDGAGLEQDPRDASRHRNLARLAPGLIHDLKGPLNSLGVNLEVLRQATRRGGDPEQLRNKQERFFKTLQGELRHLEEMLQSLLAWINPLPAEPTVLELGPLVEEQHRLIVTRARHQRVTVALQLPSRTLRVRAHRVHLDQALLNVLLNALEAMADGGQLDLEVRDEDRQAVVEVRDSGPGLPPQRREAPFRAVDGSSGLAVARALVEADGGRLEAASGPQGGTCLRFRLPLVG